MNKTPLTEADIRTKYITPALVGAHGESAADKTLTDAEANAAHEKLAAAFKTQLQATIRE